MQPRTATECAKQSFMANSSGSPGDQTVNMGFQIKQDPIASCTRGCSQDVLTQNPAILYLCPKNLSEAQNNGLICGKSKLRDNRAFSLGAAAADCFRHVYNEN